MSKHMELLETPIGERLVGHPATANAHLVATAPELLAALQALMVAIDCGRHVKRLERSNPLCVEVARAVLAKATRP